MDFTTIRNYFSVTYLVMALVVVDVIFCHQQVYNSEGDSFYEATRHYEVGNYAKALDFYNKALQEDSTFTARYPQIQFKIAYCLYQTGDYTAALNSFQDKSTRVKEIEDYADFFALRSNLAVGDTANVIRKLRTFRSRHPGTTLGGPLDSLMASLHYSLKNFKQAARYYERMLKYRRFDKGDVYGKLIRISERLNRMKSVDAYAIKLMRSYPFHPQTEYAFTTYANRY